MAWNGIRLLQVFESLQTLLIPSLVNAMILYSGLLRYAHAVEAGVG
jgi:hypothetical protein